MQVKLKGYRESCSYCEMYNFCSQGSVSSHTSHLVDTKVYQLKRGELLYSYTDVFKSVYAVNSGALKTFQIDNMGQEQIHHFYFAGELIGMEAVDTGFYPYSAVALVDTSVCELPFDNVMNIASKQINLQRQLLSSCCHRMNMGKYVMAPVAEHRLAAFIMDMSGRLRKCRAIAPINLPMSRHDIGNYLGLASETISRLFTRFHEMGWINVDGKRLSILKEEKLIKLSQGVCSLANEMTSS